MPATLVGDVRVEDEASVWYGAVLRADFGPIIVRRGANIQDGSVLHGGRDPVTEVGEGATIGHLCVVPGAAIGAEALIGNGATVLDGAVIGSRALVAAGCTVPPGLTIPGGVLTLMSALQGGLLMAQATRSARPLANQQVRAGERDRGTPPCPLLRSQEPAGQQYELPFCP